MRSGWLLLLAAGLALAPLLSVAQHQPSEVPDATAYTVREDLAEAGSMADAVRVLRFVQISDAHILDDDAPYPLRQEQLDSFGPPFTAAQRPQEEFTDEVLDSTLQAVNALHASDALQFVINTGDNIDNDLENELMRFLDLHEGTNTGAGPISGLPCQPDGQSTSVDDTAHDVTDACTSLSPALASNHDGLAPGLPWYSAFGNHDALIQGNANIEPGFQEAAADVGRYFLQQTEYVAMHFPDADSCTAVPAGTVADDFGHGYGFAGDRLCDNNPDNDGYYAFDVGGVRFLTLDTVNDDFVNNNEQLVGLFNPQTMTGSDIIGGYADGAIDPDQLAWMRAEIAGNPGKLIVVFSHHTVNSMFSSQAEGHCSPSAGCLDDLLTQAGYTTGPQLVEELAQSPNVVAWIGGHTHRHRIEAKTAGTGGFWNIESSSLIDFPQEARVIELWATANGTKGFWKLDDFGHDFQPSKDLELSDPQREVVAAGDPDDQNVLLWFDIPAGVVLEPQPTAAHSLNFTLVDDAIPMSPLPLLVQVHVRNVETGAGIAGLNVTWGAVHTPTDGREIAIQDVPTGTPMQDQGRGIYSATFLAQEAATHYLTVTAAAKAPYLAKTQILSLEVTPSATPSHGSKGTPTLGTLALAGVLAGLALARRRA